MSESKDLSEPFKAAHSPAARESATVIPSDQQLIEIALQAREAAYAPYSNFRVGSALLTGTGVVYSGCNIENSSYSLTMCAERVAIFKAASEAPLVIKKIAVIAECRLPVTPCGCCRQMIWEFGGDDTLVIMSNLLGEVQKLPIKDLLAHPFDSSFLA
jgi:cytidine deaminase